MADYALLDARGVLAIAGEDTDTFLQGLISNDVTKVTPEAAAYSAFLTPQGKYLHDFFMVRVGDVLLLDGEAARLADLKKRLSMYKLRAKATVEDASADWAVCAAWGDGAAAAFGLASEAGAARETDGGAVYVDPRLAAMGVRAILPKDGARAVMDAAGLTPGDAAAYDRARMSLGLPDGSRDLIVERALLLENGFDELHGVDWQKGCYMGQELTARTRYRGLVKKRLLPVAIDGPTPEPGTPVMLDGKEAGVMRSGTDGLGLALMRLEALDKAASFPCGDATLTPAKPDWVVFQEAQQD